MLSGAEYQAHDALGLAELVAKGEVTPAELLDAGMARLHAVNPKLNAVILTVEAEARRAIAEGLPDGPFRGVPYLIKDITTQMRGAPTTAGSRVFAKAIAADDSALVALYRKAGFVLFGKTNTPEFGLVGITEPEAFGACLNPWNLGRTCGGSSGGAAVAVAAGIVPAAQASDGGGSIRIPASCCGLFGFKPSRGRVSMAPGGEGWGGLTVLHAETRSVRDSAAILDASCAPQPGDEYWLAPPKTPFCQEVGRDPAKLRIGLVASNLLGGEMDGEIVEAVREAGRLCESLGHTVEEIAPPADVQALTPSVLTLISASLVNAMDSEAERRGRPIGQDEVEWVTWLLYEQGKTFSARSYVQAKQALSAMSRRVAPVFETYDVMLLATLGRLPLPVGLLSGGEKDLPSLVTKFYDFGPNTQLFNVTGQPAMSVPLAWSGEGLPIGIQFAGRQGEEAALFRLAGQLEAARPWFDRRPPEP